CQCGGERSQKHYGEDAPPAAKQDIPIERQRSRFWAGVWIWIIARGNRDGFWSRVWRNLVIDEFPARCGITLHQWIRHSSPLNMACRLQLQWQPGLPLRRLALEPSCQHFREQREYRQVAEEHPGSYLQKYCANLPQSPCGRWSRNCSSL